MRTKFIPKEEASPRHTFGELEVGQGFRVRRSEFVYIKVAEKGAENCISTGSWSVCSCHWNDLVTPVDLELREL